jgi:hypothetical protein
VGKRGERVLLTWQWAEESEGGGKKRARAWRPTPFELEAGDAGEDWGSGAQCDVWKGKRGRERGPQTRQGQLERPAVLRRDSGGRWGAVDSTRAADRRGRAETGPSGSGWVREGEAAWRHR